MNGNETILFEVRGHINSTVVIDFQIFGLKKNKLLIFTLIFAAFMILSNIWLGYTTDALRMLIVTLCCCIYMVFSIYHGAKKHSEDPAVRLGEEQFLFYQDHYVNTDPISQTIIRYDMLLNAYETKKYFYLFFEHNRAHIVEKAYFVYGNPEGFRSFLREKLGDKFHIKTK